MAHWWASHLALANFLQFWWAFVIPEFLPRDPDGFFQLLWCAYVEKFFPTIPESKLLLERIDDLRNRIIAVEQAHEQLIAEK